MLPWYSWDRLTQNFLFLSYFQDLVSTLHWPQNSWEIFSNLNLEEDFFLFSSLNAFFLMHLSFSEWYLPVKHSESNRFLSAQLIQNFNLDVRLSRYLYFFCISLILFCPGIWAFYLKKINLGLAQKLCTRSS